MSALTGTRRATLQRRIRLLVAATITYNVVEAVVALVAGTVASSVALIGFGLDSVIEVSSAAAVAWQVGHQAVVIGLEHLHRPPPRPRAQPASV